MKRILLAAALVGTAVVAPAAVASDALLCEVSVTIEKQPGVILQPGKVGVETGEYSPYTNCI